MVMVAERRHASAHMTSRPSPARPYYPARPQEPAAKNLAHRLIISLGHTLARSLPHSIIPALAHTLSHNPLEDYYCYHCYHHKTYCSYCHYSPSQVYYALFYAGYYSTHYGDYYNEYYSRLLSSEWAHAHSETIPDLE